MNKKNYALAIGLAIFLFSCKKDEKIISKKMIPAATVYSSDSYELFALDAATGNKKWSFNTLTMNSYINPTVKNGVVYQGGLQGDVYAVNVDGTLKWHFKEGQSDEITTDITVVNDVAYFGTVGGKLYALNTNDGSVKWSFATESNIYNSNPTVYDNLVYFGGYDGKLYAVDKNNGTLKWSFKSETGKEFTSSPIVENSVIYIMDQDNIFYAVDATEGKKGNKLWSKKIGTGFSPVSGSPIVENGSVYISTFGKVCAFDAINGNLKWEYLLTNIDQPTSPTVALGMVFFGTFPIGEGNENKSGAVYALNAGSGKETWKFQPSQKRSNGIKFSACPTIYCGNGDSTLFIDNSSFSPDKHMYSLNAKSGALKWISTATVSFHHNGPAVSAPPANFEHLIKYAGINGNN